MNTGPGVFVLTDKSTLVPMQPASFATEDDFQHLLASFPELLAGDQINSSAPRRFVLVSREQGIADKEGGGGRWSVDHLFIDQDGIPTLVEVKRSSDTRIRREVVGQMLDYAANSILHWPVEELRARFATRCEASGLDPDAEIAKLVAPGDVGVDEFWIAVRTNLLAGRVRLVFVADLIPSELRRVVEFLNRQMQPAEVLALELRQFEGQNLKTLVPVVFGQTQDAIQRKGTSAGPTAKRAWDEPSFMAALADGGAGAPAVIEGARQLFRWVRENADRADFNTNPNSGSFGPVLVRDGTALFGPFRLWSSGELQISFQYMLGRPVFGETEMREELRKRLNAVPGFSIDASSLERRPVVKLSALMAANSTGSFLEVCDWFAATYRQAVYPAA